MNKKQRLDQGSFRDPDGFIFYNKDLAYRQINQCNKDSYENFMSSGLYEILVQQQILIAHTEVDINSPDSQNKYKIIRPEKIPFISYPYEWSHTQLKDAALVILSIQKQALNHSFSLKDASAYNIQFKDGKPILIDTLSFERYEPDQPWVAYKQFCQHFLAPLALMHYRDLRLSQLLKVYIDGIPLDLASLLLPFKSYFNFQILVHIHMHAKSQKYFSDKIIRKNKHKVSLNSTFGLIDSLETAIKKMNFKIQKTEWGDYYDHTNYDSISEKNKKEIVSKLIKKTGSETLWDIGANTGVYSRITAIKGIDTISFDIDPTAVEKNYLYCIKNNINNILPLLSDITNPSPGIGWNNKERTSLLNRGPADMILALALIHHLAISNNLPLGKIASFFSTICNNLIIEFVPKQDSQVQRLLATREDIFPDYTQEKFEDEFSKYFSLMSVNRIKNSQRSIYLFENRINRLS